MKLEQQPITAEIGGETKTYQMQVPVREKDVCVIVGCAQTKEMVPWGLQNAEFWGVNNLYGVPLKGSHFDRWFEIHNIWFDENLQCLLRRGDKDFRGQSVADYFKGLSALKCPVYMQQFWPVDIPNSTAYPLQDVIDFFKAKGLSHDISRYLTNTISIELALAIYEGFKEIQVWGVDMSIGTEYQHQRPSCEFWLGLAAGLGIKIFVPEQSDLLKTRFIYGFEETKNNAFQKKIEMVRKTMKKKLNSLNAQIEQNAAAAHQYTGALQAMEEMRIIWQNLSEDHVVRDH